MIPYRSFLYVALALCAWSSHPVSAQASRSGLPLTPVSPSPDALVISGEEDGDGAVSTRRGNDRGTEKRLGQRQVTRGQTFRAQPLARLDTRVRNRIESRLETRTGDAPQTLADGAQKKRQADERSSVRPR